ncbi:MAG: thioredoxin fold domain-containing protein [Cellvibrionales bacterium]|nr:thioredoxin fold domain-containing protein [Cellvibrionales bacterium]
MKSIAHAPLAAAVILLIIAPSFACEAREPAPPADTAEPQSAVDSRAVAENTVPTVPDTVLARLRNARPDLEFEPPQPSPVPGYYEVSIGGAPPVYVSADGGHFFAGELYLAEPDGLVNATEKARERQRVEQLASLDPAGMIIFSPQGETRGVMTVFTDVTCGYCRKLHDQVPQMNALGIEVRYLGYPRSGVERDGSYTHEFEQTVKAWCAEDRREALTRLKNGQPVKATVCEGTAVPQHYAVGNAFGIRGTPAVVLGDGRLFPGYRSAQEYAAILGIADISN